MGISSITWTWTQSAGATGYRVLSSTGGGNISGDLPLTTTSFTLISLGTNTFSSIRVQAFDAVPATADSAVSTVCTLAAYPTGSAFTGSGPTPNTISLSWNGNGNPAGTTFYIDWWTTGGSTVVFSTFSANATLSNLTGNKTILLAVQARNGDGLTTPFDVTLTTVTPLISGQPVINSTGSSSLGVSSATFALGVSSINWSWSASTGATGYQVFNSSDQAISAVLAANQLTYTQTGLSTNTAYTNYIQAIGAAISTNSAPVTCYTLTMPTTGLTLLSLNSTTAIESLSWGANTNPAGTNYKVQWWSSVTSTVTLSTQSTTASLTGLFAGGTIYFTAQAQDGNGDRSTYDSTFFTVVPSTYFPTGTQSVTSGGAQSLTFLIPSGPVSLEVSSLTFVSAVTLSVQVPAANTVPAAGAGFGALPTPINLEITALDVLGNPQKPLRPVGITVTYGNVNLGAYNPPNLALARYDLARTAWVPLATSRDPSHFKLTSFTDHFSLFAVLGVASAGDLSTVTVGPVPLRPMLNPAERMIFRNLPVGTRLRVYNYAGQSLMETTADGAGLAVWDGRNKAGSWVASGIYLVLLENGGAKRILHVAIER